MSTIWVSNVIILVFEEDNKGEQLIQHEKIIFEEGKPMSIDDHTDYIFEEINKEVAKLDNNDMIVEDLIESPQENYYLLMLQKVMTSMPDVIIDDDYKKASDAESINDYTNNSVFKYFNSFDWYK